MKALVISRDNPAGIELSDVHEPTPAIHEALVAVKATSLNRGEVRRLQSGSPPGHVVGWDVAGVVEKAAADGSGPSAGERVVGLVNGGAWAERAAVATDRLGRLPDGCDFADGSTLPVAALTALRMLRKAPLLGRRVLVAGAAGGVGRFAVQLAAHAGAYVAGVASSWERAEGLQDLGAHEVITDLASEGAEFDLILESAGGQSLAHALQRVSAGGTVISFGNSSRERTTFDVSPFYARSGARLVGFLIFVDAGQPPSASSDLEYLAALVAAKKLDTAVSLELNWSDETALAGALQALMDRRIRGKAVMHLE